MSPATVAFSFEPGLERNPFERARLTGNWGAGGAWATVPMLGTVDDAGRPGFSATVTFLDNQVGLVFLWGVKADGAAGEDLWAIAAEVDDLGSTTRTRSFTLHGGTQSERYALTRCGQLGAVRVQHPGGGPTLRFAVWAPNAARVDVVLARRGSGYVADDGTGGERVLPMVAGSDGIWTAGVEQDASLADADALVGQPYMLRIARDDGSVAYRTDLWSLMQAGRGSDDPKGAPYTGSLDALDGPPSCSVVCDPGRVEDGGGGAMPADAFWADEFRPDRPLPTRIEDLVIYELHVGALGFGRPGIGTLDDAIAFVDHLDRLGVNAVELLPIAEFETIANWGYGTSHFFAVDQAAGGTDRLKAFVKACHQRGIAVILDVCYNHFDPEGERVQWAYDSPDPTRNIYYWYEGRPGDYPTPDGGYVDNLSTGYQPRFSEEMVRQLFISSAAFLATVCHIDGFRLDQTTSIDQYPALHVDGRPAPIAAAWGAKFLRQWTRTMRLIKPGLFLTAEDYSGWAAMTQPSLEGSGFGFDATWYGDFHHNLIEHKGGGEGHLIQEAGFGDGRPLHMTDFAGALTASGAGKVVYTQSHDDCGNREGSARTIVLAVNGAPLVGETRRWAEARVRVAAGLALLSAGTPMFFMGEEVGAQRPYRYNDFAFNREDIRGLATGSGAAIFAYYQALIAFSRTNGGIRSRAIEVVEAHDANRVIAFHRWSDTQAFFVAASLAGAPYDHGYRFSSGRFDEAAWVEVFNSDEPTYGGQGVGNGRDPLRSGAGTLDVVLPATGVVVLARQ